MAVCLLLIPGLYVGSYVVLKEDPEWLIVYDGVFFYEPYSHGGSVAETVFAPIHQIDAWLWPDYWEPTDWFNTGSTSRYWPPGRRDSLVVGLNPDGQVAANRDLKFCSPPWHDRWREERERALHDSNAESGSDSAAYADSRPLTDLTTGDSQQD